jgi:hypothetical protein
VPSTVSSFILFLKKSFCPPSSVGHFASSPSSFYLPRGGPPLNHSYPPQILYEVSPMVNHFF